jgi:integrase
MKLRQVDGIANFFVNEDSGIHYVKKMVNGRVVWKSTFQTNRKAALRRYHELMTLLNEKKAGWEVKQTPTLSEWWKRYRSAKKKGALTWEREERMMKLHWLPQLGNLPLDDIKQSHIERTLNWRRKKGAAEGTVTREQSLLHAVFQSAVDDDIIAKNPLRKIARSSYKTRTQVLTETDQDKVLAIASPMFGRWMRFLLGTGLRFAEAQRLTAPDIDWGAPAVTVTGKGKNGEPKVRTVPLLDPLLVTILREQLEENATQPKRQRMQRGAALWPQSHLMWRNELVRYTTKAGVGFFTPHVLRHSFATRYLQSGGDIYVLSKILGHASVTVTEKVYAHLVHTDVARLSAHVNLRLA